MTKSDERERMARMLAMRPNCPDDWPIDFLDGLIAGEKEHGDEWLHRELRCILAVRRQPIDFDVHGVERR